MSSWVAFDTETTGIEPGSRLLDLAGIAFDDAGTVLSTFERLVHPGMPVPADATEVHGITDDALEDQASAQEVLAAFLAWLPQKTTLIAHNAPYDCDILTWEFQCAGLQLPSHPVMDTCQMAKELAETQDNTLQTLIRHHRLRRVGSAHRALPDADAVRQYFLYARTRLTPQAARWAARCSYPSLLPEALGALPSWIAGAIPVRIRYTDRKGHVTERTLTPYGYATTGSGIMVHGLCHQAQDRRTFSAERLEVLAVDLGTKSTHSGKKTCKSLSSRKKKMSHG